MSFKISLKDTSFHISINSLGLYFSAECWCWIFSQTCIFYHVWENFQIYRVHIPRKCIKPRHFYSCRPLLSLTHTNSPRHFFLKICFPQHHKGVEETMIGFIRIQSEEMKMNQNTRLFMLWMICIFFQMWWLYSFVNKLWY